RTLWQNPVYRAKKDGYTEKIAIMTPKQGYAAEKIRRRSSTFTSKEIAPLSFLSGFIQRFPIMSA
ncbi:hypothetical protein, partial [Acinetobacter baumannii]|uniref:hypothetical protein n=1 Tax=Acinetobacter baumannii TaxID=470 RepID=UPI0031F40E4C